MRVGVVTDSTCDLAASTLLRLGVAFVPLSVKVGSETYREWRDLSPLTLYGWMASQGIKPEICAPEPEEFLPVYKRALDAYGQVLSIHHSSRLSATLDNAREAASRLGAEERIRFVDSGAASAVLAEMVMAASDRAAAGGDLDQVHAAAWEIRANCALVLRPRTHRWLPRNLDGSLLQNLSGRLLGRLPLLTFADGSLRSDGSTRPDRSARAIFDGIRRRFGDAPLCLTLAHAGNNRDEIEDLKRGAREAGLTITRGRVQLMGPSIGSYLGPGATAVCAFPSSLCQGSGAVPPDFVPAARGGTLSGGYPRGRPGTSPG